VPWRARLYEPDPEALARDLGFAAVSENALDAVMDRDFAAEFVFTGAQTQTHLARLAEDLIWLSAPEFGFFGLPDAYTTGSSLMPQKKNPDSLELIRGNCGRVDSDLLRLLAPEEACPPATRRTCRRTGGGLRCADCVNRVATGRGGVVAGLGLDREAMRRAAGHEEMAAGLAVAGARACRSGRPTRSSARSSRRPRARAPPSARPPPASCPAPPASRRAARRLLDPGRPCAPNRRAGPRRMRCRFARRRTRGA
jgi:argininosuccinate lyase